MNIEISELYATIDTDYQENPCISITHLEEFNSTYQALEEIVRDDASDAKQKMEGLKTSFGILNMHIDNRVRDSIESLEDANNFSKNWKELVNLQDTYQKTLCKLKEQYGDDSLEISEKLLKLYEEIFELKILSSQTLDGFTRITIAFVIEGKLIDLLPVGIDLDMKTDEVFNVHLPSEFSTDANKTVIKWFHQGHNLQQLVAKLREIIIVFKQNS